MAPRDLCQPFQLGAPIPSNTVSTAGTCGVHGKENLCNSTGFFKELSPLPTYHPEVSQILKEFEWHSPGCCPLFPWWPAAFHSRWMYRRTRSRKRWRSGPLSKPGWVLVSGSFQDPPKSLTSLHSWNVWDTVLLKKGEAKRKIHFKVGTAHCKWIVSTDQRASQNCSAITESLQNDTFPVPLCRIPCACRQSHLALGRGESWVTYVHVTLWNH